MAYIPKDDESQQEGMNVLSVTSQNQPSEEQNQAQETSGGQSSTIGSGASQNPSKAPSAAPKTKKASSGMFANIRKYIDQNKAGAGQMSGKLQSNISQQNQNIQQAVSKQKTDFMSRVNQNRQRLTDAQTFGQNTLQQAQTQQSQPMLQQQQQDLQQRYDQFDPNLVDQTQIMQQNQQAQTNQQQVVGQAQQGYEQAQTNFKQQAQQLGESLNVPVQSGEQVRYNHFMEVTGRTPEYYTQEQIQRGLLGGDQTIINSLEQALNTTAPINEGNTLSEKLDLLNRYKQGLSSQDAAQKALEAERLKSEDLQTQYGQAQEQQRLYENKNQLQTELEGIQQKIQNAPDELTEDDITRFNNLRTGIERFDDAILNLATQDRDVETLMSQAESLQNTQGRRELMRQEFGKQGGYTSGQASLDNLILTGSPEAMSQLIDNANIQAKEAQDTLNAAYKEGRITQDEMTRGTKQIQEDLQTGVEEAQATLAQGNEEFRELTELRKEQEEILNNQFATEEEINAATSALESIEDQITSFTGEKGLAERARTGEGTFIDMIKSKLESGQGLSDEEMNILGITSDQVYNADPTELLQNLEIDPNQYSIQDVANLTDVARADALARLSGEQEGENRYVNEQLGIDVLDRQDIAARNTRSAEENFTRTREELPEAERAMLDQFTQDLGAAKFETVDQARVQIKQNLIKADGNIEPVSGMIQSLVEDGSTGWEFGTVDLDKILSGDLKEAGKISHSNYWAWAGRGRHGVSFNPQDIVNLVKQTYAQTQALKVAYTSPNSNSLMSENTSGYSNLDNVKGLYTK